jgi:hypothetical protein
MVDADAGLIEKRRADAVTPAAIVLTVDAVALLMVAVVGLPFLIFFFGDEAGGWQGLWPYVIGWVAAAVFGAAAAAAAGRFAGFGTYDARRVGIVASAGIAVLSGTILAFSVPGSPLLALTAAPFAAANLAAALALLNPERAGALVGAIGIGRTAPDDIDDVDDMDDVDDIGGIELPTMDGDIGGIAVPTTNGDTGDIEVRTMDGDIGGIEVPTKDDDTGDIEAPTKDDDTGDIEAQTKQDLETGAEEAADRNKPSVDLLIAPATRYAATALPRRRPRGQAALHTLQGVRLPRRAVRR